MILLWFLLSYFLVIYDFEDDPTLQVIKKNFEKNEIICIKNKYFGFNGAIKTGFESTISNAAILYPADDHQNFNLISKMFNKFKEGYDIVCASRFIKGGSYEGAPLLKKLIVKFVSFTLSNFTTLPTKDATNSIELLAKAHRSKLRITELPEKWPVRTSGVSKFKYYTIPFYFKWYLYILFSSFI